MYQRPALSQGWGILRKGGGLRDCGMITPVAAPLLSACGDAAKLPDQAGIGRPTSAGAPLGSNINREDHLPGCIACVLFRAPEV